MITLGILFSGILSGVVKHFINTGDDNSFFVIHIFTELVSNSAGEVDLLL